jgi:hypothetical protein
MGRLRKALACSISVALTCALSAPAWAQQASGIAGLVTDTSGAVLPGVTVEAASPALIEKVRSVVTASDGRYNIIDLRPGAYTVTFTVPGFNTLRREGIVLSAGFTGTVNAELQVGALEETVTVTGASPLVDTQNVAQQSVLSRTVLDTLPASVQGTGMISKFVPGLQSGASEVGGASGLYTSSTFGRDTFRGKSGPSLSYDGMNITNFAGAGGHINYAPNFASVQEVAVESGGASAESDATNVRVNLIPKEGGNRFTSDTSWVYTNNHFQSDNLSDDLRSRGVRNTNKLLHLGDVNFTLGGPIQQNRIWFFTASRLAKTKNQVQGLYFNKTRGTPFYTPDLNRPAFRESSIKSTAARVTWQAAAKHKVNGFADVQSFQVWGDGANQALESQTRWSFYPSYVLQATWSSPQTNRLLLEGGFQFYRSPIGGDRATITDNLGFNVSPDDVAITELSTGFTYNAKPTYYGPKGLMDHRWVERFAVSYVTGSHAFKTGVQLSSGFRSGDTVVNKDVNYAFLNGVPNRITQYATPYYVDNHIKAQLGIYAQDRWTLNRLAINYGLRFDYFNGYVPAQHLPATPSGWIPARDLPEVTCVPCWTDLNPRVGASYDLFGNGRTAVKASVGRYLGPLNANVAAATNPVATSVNQVTRSWRDVNGNYDPDCELGNFNANGECGPISNQNFGKNNPLATRYADDITRGFGVRDHLWDFIGEVQHQLGSNVSISVAYNRSWTANPGDLTQFNPNAAGVTWNTGATDNLLVTPVDYSPYCITAPVDPRLPGGGGYEVCGLYDLVPGKFGQVDNVVKSQKNFGERTRQTDFFSVSVTSQVRSGMLLSGSVDTGRIVEDNCFVVDSPQQLLNCRVVYPFKGQTQAKVQVSYPFPYGFLVSGTLQNLSGISYLANYSASNAEIAPTLGRNLAACGTATICNSTVTVPLVGYQTLFDPRRTQLDLRVSKQFELGARLRLRADLDVYNATNSSAVYFANHNYGPQWQRPIGGAITMSGFMDARIVEFGGRLTW